MLKLNFRSDLWTLLNIKEEIGMTQEDEVRIKDALKESDP